MKKKIIVGIIIGIIILGIGFSVSKIDKEYVSKTLFYQAKERKSRVTITPGELESWDNITKINEEDSNDDDDEEDDIDSENKLIATLYDDGRLVIDGNGEMIEWNNLIDVPWEKYKNRIIQIDIGEGVTKIADLAFLECEKLVSINVDSSNENYSSNSEGILFNKDETTIVRYPAGKEDKIYKIPNTVTTIGVGAFAKCNNLTNVDIPSSVVKMESYSFYESKKLTSIKIPSGVTMLDVLTFYNCTSLTNISLPSRLVRIDRQVFEKCASLTNVNMPDSVEIIQNGAFKDCSNLVDINMSYNIVTIGDETFKNCTNLEFLYISEKAKNIGNSVFEGCSKLRIYCEKNSIIQQYASINKIPHSMVSLPDGVKARYIWNISEEKINRVIAVLCDNGTLMITGKGNMKNWKDTNTVPWQDNRKNIIKVEIGSEVENIGDFAFAMCNNLESVSISSNVTNIGKYAFILCNKLDEVDMPEKLASIGTGAFSNCNSLKNISIPDSVVNIGGNTFFRCSQLKQIEVAEGNENYSSEDGILFNYDKTVLIKYPEGKDDVTEYNLSSNVNSIKTNAFYGCKKLKSIKVDVNNDRYCSMDGILFDKNKEIIIYYPTQKEGTNYSIPGDVKEISEGAFAYNNNLKEVNILNSVTSIGKNAFLGCDNLLIHCVKDSASEKYAKDNGVKYEIMENVAPEVNVSYSTTQTTKEPVIVTITANEKIQEVEGWNLSEDGKTLKKEYSKNTKEEIIIKDLVGNETEVSVIIENIEEKTQSVRKIESLSLQEMPTKASYYVGETLDTEGLVLIAKYDDGEEEEITNGFVCTPNKLTVQGMQKITVTYEGKSTIFNVVVDSKKEDNENTQNDGDNEEDGNDSYDNNDGYSQEDNNVDDEQDNYDGEEYNEEDENWEDEDEENETYSIGEDDTMAEGGISKTGKSLVSVSMLIIAVILSIISYVRYRKYEKI